MFDSRGEMTGADMIVGIVPSGMGVIRRNRMLFIEKVMDGIEKSFKKANVNLSCQLIPEKPLTIPHQAYNENVGKYATGPFFDLGREMKSKVKRVSGKDIGKVLVLTDVDIFDPPYVELYGQADNSIAVVSICRLKRYRARSVKLLERTIKEAVHELGHTFGLDHCKKRDCVMNFSSDQHDIDNKRQFFCGRCTNTLETNGRETWASWDWVED